MCSSSSMDREILSKLPTLLRHKLRSNMAHFVALDSADVYKTIRNQYRFPHVIEPLWPILVTIFPAGGKTRQLPEFEL